MSDVGWILVSMVLINGVVAYEIDAHFRKLNKRIDSVINRLYNFDGHGS